MAVGPEAEEKVVAEAKAEVEKYRFDFDALECIVHTQAGGIP